MRFLADESCDFAIVRALRAAGHDVVAVTERLPGAEDQAVIDLAVREERILLTEDKDFGQLVHASRGGGRGVILLRYPVAARTHMPRRLYNSSVNEETRLPADSWSCSLGESELVADRGADCRSALQYSCRSACTPDI